MLVTDLLMPASDGVELIGAKLPSINKAEDRELFKNAMADIGLKTPPSGIAESMEDALAIHKEIGAFPLIIRPAFTLGGTAVCANAGGGYPAPCPQTNASGVATLAVALGDSPAGLAAWIVEKLESWSDGPTFTMDDLLTWVTAYWVTETIGTSFATYVEPVTLPNRIETPTVFSVFAHDLKPEPRSYAEVFVNIREYAEHPDGGHFAAWEQPEIYVDDLRRAVKLGYSES